MCTFPDLAYSAFARALGAAGKVRRWVRVRFNRQEWRRLMPENPALINESLLSVGIGDLVAELGLAVAQANKKLSAVEPGSPAPMRYVIQEAEIEVRIAINVEKKSEMGGQAGFNLSAVQVNASYSRTYGYKEEASSRILLKLSSVPSGA
jgi:hypothetical protein